MKKFILALAAMSMLATPAMAQSRDNRWGVDSNRNSPYHVQNRGHQRDYDRGHQRKHHRNRVSTGEAVAIGIGALILGAAISNKNRNTTVVERYEYPQPRYQPQYVCQDVIKYDYYGNAYVAGRNCWYQ